MERAAQKAIAAAAEWEALANELGDAFGYDSRIVKINASLRPNRIEGRVASLVRMPQHLNNPITRNDPNAKERLLVFRYWWTHRRYGGLSPAVVADLMYLEGIEHQYDLRTIERQYAAFTGKKRKEIEERRRGG
jgi:hypothetical protein